MQLPAKLSKLSPELREDFLELGKELGIDVTVNTPLKFFNTEKIKNAKMKERAEKLMKKAENEVAMLAGLHLRHAETGQAARQSERKPAFSSSQLPPEMHGGTLASRLASQDTISVSESKELLLKGNKKFAAQLTELGITSQAIKQYDAVLLLCSDSRDDPTRLKDYAERKILSLQIAGNVASKEVEDAIGKLAFKGEIIICGHSKCGACDAKKNIKEYGGISQSIDRLLSGVSVTPKYGRHVDIYAFNATEQAAKLRNLKTVVEKEAHVTPVVFEFGRPKPLITVQTQTPFVSSLAKGAVQAILDSVAQGKNIQTQFAHAIVISNPADIGRFSNLRTVFGAGQNELFCVSALSPKLSDETIASVEYALLNVQGVKENCHVVIVATSVQMAREIEQALTNKSEIIKGKARFTIMQFDRETGETGL